MIDERAVLLSGDSHPELLQDAIVVTGCPRSGTSLTGRLVGTLVGVEYFFEPPLMYALCMGELSGAISKEATVALMRVQACEGLLLEAAAGRGVNMRGDDDSYVLNHLSWSELADRWARVHTRQDAVDYVRARHLRMAVKVPGVTRSASLLKETFPGCRLVVTVREGTPTISSLVARGWFTEEGMRSNLWPYRVPQAATSEIDPGPPVPAWLPPELEAEWVTMAEWERACLLWVVEAEAAYGLMEDRTNDEHGPGLTFVRYEDLVSDPLATSRRLADGLGAASSALTESWVGQVRSRGHRTSRPANVRSWLHDRYSRVSEALGYEP